MELAKCVARSQHKDAENGLQVDFEGCERSGRGGPQTCAVAMVRRMRGVDAGVRVQAVAETYATTFFASLALFFFLAFSSFFFWFCLLSVPCTSTQPSVAASERGTHARLVV